MTVKTMQDLFVDELRDIYHAEKQLVKALPKMARAATHPELKQAFEAHLEETRGQVDRLDQVFESLDLAKRAKKCEAMEGLLEEARATMEEIEDENVLDVGMIINAQKVEHYEIAGYGSLVALAKPAGPRGRRQAAAGDPAGGEGGRREAEQDRAQRRQSRRRRQGANPLRPRVARRPAPPPDPRRRSIHFPPGSRMS